MSDFRYAPIYGRNPWLMVEDADEVADFFRNSMGVLPYHSQS